MSSPLYINARFLTQSITGVQRYAHALLDAMDDLISADPNWRGVEVVMLAPKRGIVQDKQYRNIKIRKVGFLRGHAWEQFELPFYARGGALFCPGNTAPLMSLLGSCPTVVTLHSIAYLQFPDAYSRMFRLLYGLLIPLVLRWSTAVITVSETERQSIVARYPFAAGRLAVIHNGGFPGDPVYEPLPSQSKDGRPFAMFIGSLNRLKNVQGMLAAAKLLHDQPIRFVIVGGTARSFRDAALPQQDDRSQSIEFVGQVNDPERLIEIYRTALCLVFPSFYEASPIPPVEAMECGCAVVASSIPALEERCGDAALYCDPADPADIAEKIKELLTNPGRRAKLVEQGRARAARFTWHDCARQTLAVLDAALKQGNVRRDNSPGR